MNYRVPSLKINVDKTEMMLLGTGTIWNVPKEYRNLIKDEVTLLCITHTTDLQRTIKRNYTPTLDKIRNKLALWSKQNMSLAGKITMVKTMVRSQLVYCMTCPPSPNKEYWKEVNKAIFRFLVNNKNEKLKRNTLIGP